MSSRNRESVSLQLTLWVITVICANLDQTSKQSNLSSFRFIFGCWLHNRSRKQHVRVRVWVGVMVVCHSQLSFLIPSSSSSSSSSSTSSSSSSPACSGQTVNQSAGQRIEVIVHSGCYCTHLNQGRACGCILGKWNEGTQQCVFGFTLIWFLLKQNVGGRVNRAAAGSCVVDTVKHNAKVKYKLTRNTTAEILY